MSAQVDTHAERRDVISQRLLRHRSRNRRLAPARMDAAAFSEIEAFPRAVLKHHYPRFPCTATSPRSEPTSMAQLTFLSEAPPASRSQSPALEAEWMTSAVNWRSSFSSFLIAHAPDGWCGRTSPASCRRTEDGTLVPSSEGWSNSGMGSPTESWTLSTSEFHSAAVACSLSDILETGDVPRRFYLSATACRGILRRAEKRGKSLPPSLPALLVAQPTTAPGITLPKRPLLAGILRQDRQDGGLSPIPFALKALTQARMERGGERRWCRWLHGRRSETRSIYETAPHDTLTGKNTIRRKPSASPPRITAPTHRTYPRRFVPARIAEAMPTAG
jgi:hypothetical protein